MSIQSLNGPGDSGGVGGLNPVVRNTETSAGVAAQAVPTPVAAPAQTTAPVQPVVARQSAQSAQATPEPSQADVKAAVEKVQQAVQSMASSLKFSVDQETGKSIVTLTDTETGETIRQMPSKEMIELARNIDRIQGMLLKQKA